MNNETHRPRAASSRYNTEEKRKKHAEYQRKWREANPDKAKAIDKKSRQAIASDDERAGRRKQWLKESSSVKKRKAAQKLRRYKKTQGAENSHRRWTVDEIKMAFDRGLTDAQISNAIGRSVQAVGLARIRYASMAPSDWIPKA